ncbi:MAG TPA: hypothetical protein VLR71_18215 [Casimicrobiaceae bacterium]|nr:hypothetical protein [Casimicrobiaceae bacterium]
MRCVVFAVLYAIAAAGVLPGTARASVGLLPVHPLGLLYDAAFVAQTVPPVLEIAATAPVSITMRNTGLATWAAGDVFLATQEPQDNYYWCIQDNPYGSHSGNRVVLLQDVVPGQSVTFDFHVKPLGCIFAATAPFRFRMLSQSAGTFGEETPDPAVTTTSASEFVEQQVPTPVPAAAKVTANVTFRNTTQTTWTAAAGYALVGANGAAATWSVAPTAVPADVLPAATVVIPVRLTAPTATGTHPLQVQMSLAGTPFGQVSVAAPIVVVPAGAPNYQGLWWAKPAAAESGWGINFAHQQDAIFATWFTYDQGGSAVWLTMTALQNPDGTFTGDILRQTGPPFSSVPFRPTLVRSVRVGSGSLSFTDATNASFDYVVDGVHQTKAITQQVFRYLPTCTSDLVADPSVAFNYQDLWWAAPAFAESGWGINLAHQGSVIFATWFTYASDGTPMWVSATLPQTAKATYAGAIVRTTGPPFDSVPFDPARVTVTKVGTMQLAFTNGNQGTFDYTLDGVTQTKTITRQIFRGTGTICQ